MLAIELVLYVSLPHRFNPLTPKSFREMVRFFFQKMPHTDLIYLWYFLVDTEERANFSPRQNLRIAIV